MIDIQESQVRTVDTVALAAAERKYPAGHYVAFHDYTEECGNSGNFEKLMEDLLNRGFTPEKSVIVQIGESEDMLYLFSDPN